VGGASTSAAGGASTSAAASSNLQLRFATSKALRNLLLETFDEELNDKLTSHEEDAGVFVVQHEEMNEKLKLNIMLIRRISSEFEEGERPMCDTCGKEVVKKSDFKKCLACGECFCCKTEDFEVCFHCAFAGREVRISVGFKNGKFLDYEPNTGKAYGVMFGTERQIGRNFKVTQTSTTTTYTCDWFTFPKKIGASFYRISFWDDVFNTKAAGGEFVGIFNYATNLIEPRSALGTCADETQ